MSSASVRIIPSELGTQPLKIVQSAIAEFQKTQGFEKVFVVFDRDDHPNYANAIAKAEAQDKKLLNDDGCLTSSFFASGNSKCRSLDDLDTLLAQEP
jgi:hypothetical protein